MIKNWPKLSTFFSNSEKKKLVKLNKKIAKVIFTSFKEESEQELKEIETKFNEFKEVKIYITINRKIKEKKQTLKNQLKSLSLLKEQLRL